MCVDTLCGCKRYLYMYQHQQWKQQVIRARAKAKLYYLFAMNNDESKKNEAIICHLMECTTPARPYLAIWRVALLEWQTIHFYNTGPCGTVAEKPNRHLTSKYI